MKAQRATIELGMLGGWYLVAGIVALAQVAGRGGPEFGVPAAVLGVLVISGSIAVIALAVHRLREIEGLLQETAQRLSGLWVAARVSLLSALPVGTVIVVATASPGAGWILGLACAVLGVALCTAAALAVHVEHLAGARVFRASDRFYFAR
jgi:hypothetical protein